jgi:hypothetical protein
MNDNQRALTPRTALAGIRTLARFALQSGEVAA